LFGQGGVARMLGGFELFSKELDFLLVGTAEGAAR
jgi:hypothetical protein